MQQFLAWLSKPFIAAVGIALVSLCGTVGTLLLNYDRRTPFIYSRVTLTPVPAVAGQLITIHREVVWLRQCEGAGEVWREIIRPNGGVSQYDRRYTRLPEKLGMQVVTNSFVLDEDVLDNGETEGTAIFRVSVWFHDCGWTSKLYAVAGPILEIPFKVRK